MLLIGVGIAALLSACGDGESGPSADNATNVRSSPIAAVELRPRDLSRQLRLSATVEPRVTIRVASRRTGNIEKVLFEEGEVVRQGQLLVLLDMSEEIAELARAHAEMEQANLEYKRLSELRDSGAVSVSEYQRARANYQVAQSLHELWQTRVTFGRITAPRDGVITARYVEPGEAVQAQQVLMALASARDLVLRLAVSEMDVVHLQPGQPVPVRFDALPEQDMEGTLRRIFPTAESDSRLITVEVSLPEEAASQGVRPGFLARVNMAVDARPNVLAVPSAALGEDDDTHYVYVVVDDQLLRRDVTVGVARGRWTEISAGLEGGDIVLATNPIDMREGQRVRIVGWRE